MLVYEGLREAVSIEVSETISPLTAMDRIVARNPYGAGRLVCDRHGRTCIDIHALKERNPRIMGGFFGTQLETYYGGILIVVVDHPIYITHLDADGAAKRAVDFDPDRWFGVAKA